ncbi:mechanosensitive ion channel family protein [Ruania suaedae]|uniref:mechanosensitive ion channel family protein n=1 Tax=Ruania suaedae TaxID=2897774 RepID=UPI001E60B1A6|nr:mechanosensitive ion channel domain-containing protein [Ruania suaedae]UFU03927.1 mechanosensitive ion channel family protein [Ruania suaedae]
MDPWLSTLIAIVAAVAGVVLLLLIANAVLLRIGRRVRLLRLAWLKVRRPLSLLLVSIALRIAVAQSLQDSSVRTVAMHVLLIAILLSAVWLVERFVLAWLTHLKDHMIKRMRDDDRARRRVETQMLLIRRIVAVAFTIIAIALVLLTFPGVEQVGATVLASAGLLSVVIGVAAQATLGNVFAGLQLAFTDAIRIGDVVEVDGTWSTIEDITLSYVVVSIWDERHKVLPSTYFTTTPFINWSRTGDTVTGVIYFTLDWRVNLEALRREFERVLEASQLWDRRASSVVVTDSTGDRLTVRALVTSKDSDSDWALRCEVREKLATWLREHNPEALPVQRVILPEQPEPGAPEPVAPGRD